MSIIDLIFVITLFISLLGMLAILFRKIPALVSLPADPLFTRESLFPELKNRAQALPVVGDFSFVGFLQKILLKLRILILKAENQTTSWQGKLRKESQDDSEKENDNYWEELRKAKDGK